MKVCLLLIGLFICCATNAQHKSRTSFNNDWEFSLDSTNWRKLNLPHDWSIEGAFSKDHPAGTGGGALPGGMGWYRKTFSLKTNQQVFIEFDGVYRNSEVFINGHSLGVRPNGYISFYYDLTPWLQEKNTIVVKVDNSKQPNSRWYSGSGIYRNVWLTVLNKAHIDHWGTFITTPSVTEKAATVNITTKFTGNAQLITTIYDAAGNKVASGENTIIQNPKLWSVERPYLYKAVSQVKVGPAIVDTYETYFGIRYFNFDANTGFSLNGKPLKILGVCNHHDLGALGAAINTRALERQLEILKAMGCNGIRTSHNPPAPELLALADKLGFIIMDEAFDMWAKKKTEYDYHLDWKQWHKKDLEDFIVRDRNHPSVFIWSVGNEIGEQWGDDTTSQQLARELARIVRSLDTTRPITTGNNEIRPFNNLIKSGAFDLIGYNYQHAKWGDFPKDYPGKKLIVTESTSALETRGHYDLVPFDTIRRWPKRWDLPLENGNPDFTVSAYDHVSAPWGSTHEESVRAFKQHAHVSGMYIWTGFDYLGEPTPYPWPARSSYFGIIDLAGFPKDVYYLYQAEFANTPVLHLFPHWNWKAGDTVEVVCYYNNADEVELFLNGRSLGARAKQGDNLHVKWRVPYTPGTVKAVSKKNGNTVLTKEIKTAAAAYKLTLKADRQNIHANGNDLSFVTVEITDNKGVLVPDADHLIKFSVTGPGAIAGVDSGSPVSLEPFKASQHTAMNGKALCIIQSKGRKGEITLTATAGNLHPASIVIKAN